MTPASPPVRASDEDRERVVELLHSQRLAGRLTADEFEGRVELAYGASTRAELDALIADFPRSLARQAAAPAHRPWVPGLRQFAIRFEADTTAEAVVEEAMKVIAPRLISYGYRMEIADPNRLVFTLGKQLWPLAALALFPFGLAALPFVRWDDSQLVLSAKEAGPGRTTVDVFGVAPLSVRRAMVQLERSR